MKTEYLEVDDILKLHQQLVDLFSVDRDPIIPSGPRDLNLVASALTRPQTSLNKVEKYPTIELKAAALFHSLVKNHAFHNGNKRTALFATLAFLARNGKRVKADTPDDDLFDLVLSVATDTFPQPGLGLDAIVAEIAKWVRDRTSTVKARASSMRTRDFISKCESVGLRVREDSLGWQIVGNGGIVKIGHDHRELKGGVIRIYLQNLGINEAETGITVDSFQEGVTSNQELLLRFQAVLKRLAHA